MAVKLGEIKRRVERKIGQTMDDEFFVLALNSCYRELSSKMKLTVEESFENLSVETGEEFFKLDLENSLVQVMSVTKDKTKAQIIGINDGEDIVSKYFFTYRIDGDSLLVEFGKNTTVDKIVVRYYKAIPTIEFPIPDNFNIPETLVPFLEDWHSDIIALYIIRDFWESFEDDEQMKTYDIMYERKLRKVMQDVSRRHRNESSRFAKRNRRR